MTDKAKAMLVKIAALQRTEAMQNTGRYIFEPTVQLL